MKNVHRMYDMTNIQDIKENIHITSDEEIKEGDWCLDLDTDTVFKMGDWETNRAKKIILTTDQDLIKDGVQAIDDEFLEWFVKNTSCEEVEVKKEYITPLGDIVETCYDNERLNYKIIIPKEEPKQEIDMSKYTIGIDPYDKHETLEEAANRQWGNVHRTGVLGFIDGAKWQQKRSYSEEDMREAFYNGWLLSSSGASFRNAVEKWFEQNKNK